MAHGTLVGELALPLRIGRAVVPALGGSEAAVVVVGAGEDPRVRVRVAFRVVPEARIGLDGHGDVDVEACDL